MQWNEIKTNWAELKTQFHDKWTKLTPADLTSIKGDRNALITRLQTLYKSDRAKLEKEVDSFIKNLKAHA